MTQSLIAAQAEELAKSIWYHRNICEYTEFDRFLLITIPTIEAALTAAAAQEHEKCNQSVQMFYKIFYNADWDVDKINQLLVAAEAPQEGR